MTGDRKNTARPIFIVLFAALISSGCFISIPLPGGVPITLQNMAAILSALVLGGLGGFISVILFLFAGLIGLPVFSGGRGGIAVIIGPTGGFLIGYAFGALAAGLIAGKANVDGGKRQGKKGAMLATVRLLAASCTGFIIILLFGTVRFMLMTGRPLIETLFICVLPFLPGDIIKIILAALAAGRVRNMIVTSYAAASA